MLGLGNTLTGGAVSQEVTPATLGELIIWFQSDGFVNSTNLDNKGTSTFTFNPSGPVVNTGTFSGGTTTQGVSFDDSNDLFTLSAAQVISDAEGLTVFYVMNQTNIANTDMIFAGDSDSRNQIHHYNKRNIQVRFNSDGGTTNAGVTLNTYSTTSDDGGVTAYDFTDGDEIVVLRKDADAQKLTVFNRKKQLVYSKSENGEDATASPATYTGETNAGIRVTRIGIKAGGGSPAGGVYGDIGIFKEDLSDAKIYALIDYLAAKFGISQS